MIITEQLQTLGGGWQTINAKDGEIQGYHITHESFINSTFNTSSVLNIDHAPTYLSQGKVRADNLGFNSFKI